MSILHESPFGWFISHENYINNSIKNAPKIHAINPQLFEINVPYKKKKSFKKVLEEPAKKVKTLYEKFLIILRENGFLLPAPSTDNIEMNNNNSTAAKAAQLIYDQSGKSPLPSQLYGENRSGNVVIQKINNANYVIPDKCQFYCNDIGNIASKLVEKGEKFDFILLDPPWWNKYIRRKRKRQSTTHAYNMIFNAELERVPIENLLKLNQADGAAAVVAIWCTNSVTHLNYLKHVILPKWGLEYRTTWYWVKITNHGELVTEFTEKNGKQPFEQIVIATRGRSHTALEEKLILSVPSAIHSHKPPILEIIKNNFFSGDVATLEIFARYLLPNCCSYGNEVLRFQHECVFRVNEQDKLVKEI